MGRSHADIRYLLPLLLPALLLTTTTRLRADEPEAPSAEKIHRQIVVHCEEDGDCSEGIHIETHGDFADTDAGSHSMVWIGDGSHADHFPIHSSFLGKGGYLGVQLTGLTPELRNHFGVPEDSGVMVARVLDGTAAFRAGLMVGDIITQVDGQPVASARDLAMTIRQRGEGDTVDLEIWRDGSRESLSATLDELDRPGLGHHAVIVECGDQQEGCDCMVDGEAVDCESAHGMHSEAD